MLVAKECDESVWPPEYREREEVEFVPGYLLLQHTVTNARYMYDGGAGPVPCVFTTYSMHALGPVQFSQVDSFHEIHGSFDLKPGSPGTRGPKSQSTPHTRYSRSLHLL